MRVHRTQMGPESDFIKTHKYSGINHFLNTLYLDSGVGWILVRFLTCSKNKAPGLERLLKPVSLFSFVNGKQILIPCSATVY